MATTKDQSTTHPFDDYAISRDYGFDTLALHAGAFPDPATGAILTPIYQTTTYRQAAVGHDKGFTYSRSRNPTVSALEARLAALEGAEFCTCYGTVLAATTALCLALLSAGDRVVVSQAVYGGTVRLFRQVFANFRVGSEPHRVFSSADQLNDDITLALQQFINISSSQTCGHACGQRAFRCATADSDKLKQGLATEPAVADTHFAGLHTIHYLLRGVRL